MKTENQRSRLKVVLPLMLCLVGALTVVLVLRPRKPAPPEAISETAEPVQPGITAQPAVQPVAVRQVLPPGKPPQEWGIEVVGIYPSVGGRALDLRYKVLDAVKAARLPDEKGGIYLVDEAGTELIPLPNSPKTGSTPQNPQKLVVGANYSFGFPNPGGRFKSGSKLTVVIGSFRAEHLVVQ